MTAAGSNPDPTALEDSAGVPGDDETRCGGSLIVAAVVFRTLVDLLEACFEGPVTMASEGADFRYLELVAMCRRALSSADVKGELATFPEGLPDSLTEFMAECNVGDIHGVGIAAREPWEFGLQPCLTRYRAAFIKEVARRGLALEYDRGIAAVGEALNLGVVAEESKAIRAHTQAAWKQMVANAERRGAVVDQLPAPPLVVSPDYESVLRIVRDSGVEMERHPAIYAGKDEETLRDHLILVLSPHFQSVTGETFNRRGKTDILIRHEGKNVLVAECKFWKGPKGFHDTIDQVLGYLTWRDSKAAVVCFIRNKELNPVLEQIAGEASKHSCFLKDHGRKEEGWFQFEFHLPGDHTRSVHLAVLCFHFPAG